MEEEFNSKVGAWSLIVIAGIVLYVAIDVLLAFLRPDYSLIHNAESDYGRGPYSWVMDLNFLLRCLFSLALVKAISITFSKNNAIKKATYWLVAWAIASGLLAFFADSPYGYPHVWTTPVHSLLAVVAFVGVTVGMILLSTRFMGIQSWRKTAGLLIAITILAIISLVFIKLTGFNPHKAGGLFERIFLGLVLVWEGTIAVKIISKKSSQRQN